MKAHEQLLIVSRQKTDQIREGLVEELQTTLIKERKIVQTTVRLEEQRIRAVNQWAEISQLSEENATMTWIIEQVHEVKDRTALEKVTAQLVDLIVEIKQQEQLNEALLEQSMQFVQLSLEMLNPTIENFNYNKEQQAPSVERSVFDSKA